MSAKLAAELKALETRRNKLQAEKKVLGQEINDKQGQFGIFNRKIKELQENIEALKKRAPKNIVVTEHAMLRYLERVDGLDLQELHDRILTPESQTIIDKLGTCRINTPDEVVLVVRDKNVITIAEKFKKTDKKG